MVKDPHVLPLFVSNTLEAVAESLVSVFTGAFIWRISGSLLDVALFPAAQFAVQPFFFWLNGVLLRKYDIRRLLLCGAILAGLADLSVIMFAVPGNPWIFVALGVVRGFSQGLYWPNRNHLELQEIPDATRNRFYGSIQSVFWFVGIVLPYVVGWGIAAVSHGDGHSLRLAYGGVFFLSLVFMTASGMVVVRQPYKSPVLGLIHRFKTRPMFSRRRLLGFIQGLTDGLSFVGPLMVIMFLGDERTIGVLIAVATCVAVAAVYVYGRFSGTRERPRAVLAAAGLYAIAAAAMLVLSLRTGVTLFVVLSDIALGALSAMSAPIYMALSDEEMNGDETARYSFVFDNELVLNLGRVVGIVILLVFSAVWSSGVALTVGLLAVSLIQVVCFATVFRRGRLMI